MFSKLSQRERLLVIVVGLLFPAALVMYFVVTINGTLADKTGQIDALVLEQQELQLKRAAAQRVVSRGEYYRQESLPSDTNRSLLDYYAWLNHLGESCFSGSKLTISKGVLTAENQGIGDLIFSRQEFTLSTTATLRKVTEFLYRFNETKLLHRIKSLSLKPEIEGAGERQTMTGRLIVSIGVEVAALASADAERDFANEKRESMLRTLEEYQDVVTRRNLFGMPNNGPEFTTSGSQDILTGRPVSLTLAAKDDGEAESLEYELVESSSPDAKLEVRGGKATFSAPALPKGRHKFLVRVTDNGWPRKSADLDLSINIDDPAPEIVKQPDPPPKYARYAFISGFTTNLQGAPVVWIKVPQPDNETHRLTVGESFTLDGKSWNVTAITGGQVTLEVDGESMKFRLRSLLTEPVVESAGISSNR